MQFKKLLSLSAALFMTVAFTACGDDSSSSASDEESSSSVPSFKSSSSLSTRADIDYKDTVKLGDTLRLYVDLFKGDSSKMDESEIYLDSTATTLPMYLGEFPKGSRINVFASTSNIESEQIRIKSEYGDYLQAIKAAPKTAARKDSVYRNSLIPSYGADSTATFRDSNTFVTFNDNHYFLEVEGEFSDESSMKLKVLVDTSYYKYTGEDEKISMKMNDTLRGILLIDNAPKEVSIAFSANEGYSVNLTTVGENIILYKLTDGDKELGSSKTNLDTMLVPNDSVNWSIKIKPESFSSIWTGPYAFFETITKARELEQGEYFSNPDSIKYPGEAYERTRPKDDIGTYKYNLRQEQFVWIGDYKKGDSVIVKHWIQNYNDENFQNVSIEVLNKKKKSQATISSVYGGSFKVSEDGPYYLHYLRLNSDPLDQGIPDSLRYVLQLYTMVQQPGLLKEMKFYDSEKDAPLKEKVLAVGDTMRFEDFDFTMTPHSKTSWKIIGSDIAWFVPCKTLDYLNNSSNYKSGTCDEEQEISSNYLIALEGGIGEKAELIAQSVADPSMRDTLTITIIAKAD
ncbi:hypothetical protein [Fibrobacter sp. UWB5]|uniref:hypothetical protein n=1 Tax=Fibrobacter sp. UWB5 TaxID=1964360 RepID=UPI000B5214FA|nr:hypothetical protein [Fibrobacter sp. UWB5]